MGSLRAIGTDVVNRMLRDARGSSDDEHFIQVDLDQAVSDFIQHADMSLDDLSYDVVSCIENWTRYQFDDTAPDTICRLAEEMYLLNVVKSRSDGEILATYAMMELYPEMTRTLTDLGYSAASVYSVKFMSKPGRRIRCTVTFAVP